MPKAVAQPDLWVISDGRRGIENQALGLAEAMQRQRPLKLERHTVRNTGLFKALPAKLQFAIKSDPSRYGLPATLPDMAIGCGRQAIAPLLSLKSRGVYTIYVQDPRIDTRRFDQVVAPDHDGLAGENVISMIGAPNRIDPAGLAAALDEFSEALAPFKPPRVGILIGGASKTHTLTPSLFDTYLAGFTDLLEQGYSLLISPSRRTPEWARERLFQFAADQPFVWVWDGQGANPYMAFLAGSDALLVSEDSTNMLSEACTTGKPVYRLPMDGSPGKFASLYQDLETGYGLRPFSGEIDTHPTRPLRETERVAALVWQGYGAR